MGKYKAAVVTDEGISIIVQVLAEKRPITFTNVKTSSYAYPPETDIRGMTDLQDIVQEERPSAAEIITESAMQTTVRFDNELVTEAYLIETIGVYAKVDGGTEKLFAVLQAETPDQMPAQSPVSPSSYIYDIQIGVLHADQITVTVDPAGVATVLDIERLEKGKSHIVVIPENEDIPVADRKPNTWYLKVTDRQTAIGSDIIKVSPNMGFKIL